MDLFRVRLNCVDHYQSSPTRFDPQLGLTSQRARGKDVKIPVIRVFGATQTGQKVCAHIHGAFPYLYIEYEGSVLDAEVNEYTQRLHLSIDHALAVSYRRNLYDGNANFVAHISLVKGVPFYGFYVGHKLFLKIYLLNPLHMTRLADLLRQGAVMKKTFQPYESHLQYLLQWMCDYNLYGCGYIDCSTVTFRHPVPDQVEMRSTVHLWHSRSIAPETISSPEELSRQSHCSIEVDICIQDIVNRKEIRSRPMHHDFSEMFSPPPPDEKLVYSMAGLWRDETRRRKSRMSDASPDSSPFPPEVMVSMSAEPRSSRSGGWIHEDEYMQLLRSIIANEKSNDDARPLTFENVVKRIPREEAIQSTLESVEDLFPDKLRASAGKTPNIMGSFSENDISDGGAVDVDESRITMFAEEDFSFYPQGDSDARGDTLEPEAPAEQLQDQREEALMSGALGPRAPQLHDAGSAAAAEVDIRDEHSSGPADEYTNEAARILLSSKPEQRSKLDSRISKRRRVIRDERPTIAPPPEVAGNSSQEKGLGRSVRSCNQTLSFTVVKDPSDPGTIQRLSQQSDSPPGNQNAQKRRVSFQPPTPPPEPLTTYQPKASRKLSVVSSDDTSQLRSAVLNLSQSFDSQNPSICYSQAPPSAKEIVSTMQQYHLLPILYQDAHYSNEIDVPERSREYAGRDFRLEGLTVPFLPEFDPNGSTSASESASEKSGLVLDREKEEKAHRVRRYGCKLKNWEFAEAPPSRAEVERWMLDNAKFADDDRQLRSDVKDAKEFSKLSQIDGPTQKNRCGFKFTQRQESTSVQHEVQYMSLLSLEVHVNTRADLKPNPEQDEVAAIFWCIQDDGKSEDGEDDSDVHTGILVLSEGEDLARKISRHIGLRVEEHSSELDLMTRMVDIVRLHDPDILTGYEVHNSSWGYLIERARYKYDYDLCDEFSRMKSQSHGRFGKEDDRWGFNHTSTIRVTGRHMINIWRAMRSEINLLQYTMENVAFHVLHRRIPHFSSGDLTSWYKSGKLRQIARTVEYYVSRVRTNLEILDENELVARTSEQARLLGVDFFSVFSRGSQFKVESLMFRIAKPENYLLVSPSRKDVGGQNALECLPLVMEPQSDFYNSPLLVLDFQSLYPSVMIAYNYCYSTYLGRVVNWRGQNKMGFTEYNRQQRLLELLKDQINIAPNGIMYCKPAVRKSLLAKMLGEILETRVMVKSGMKMDKDDRALQRLLNNRQLALKLIANVTYGYTSASFSGRMPCSEIADSIVQTGRETLEKTIALIHSVKRWGAEVVYGDTDSLFVYLKGRSKDQAFDIGAEIADTVTNMNPRPIKLKFEKVYFPSVLLAKKRYVGFKYESKSQAGPEFDAKGIETVRRDGTPAEQKIEEAALKILFRTADLSQVKSYFQDQCSKIMRGKVSIQDFCFAREVKLGSYSERGIPPPGALISTRRMLKDPRSEPQYGERVPYVVITGAPGARLIDRCVAPEELLHNDHNDLDAEYYISKNLIPPLERIFNLVGANVRGWYDEMPKFQRVRRVEANHATNRDGVFSAKKMTLESYMKSSMCLVCRDKLDSDAAPICDDCSENADTSLLTLRRRLMKAESKAADLDRICRSCAGLPWGEEVSCDSKDCPVFYSRVRHASSTGSTKAQIEPIMRILELGSGGKLDW
ncbi:MAG: hypothetical protein M1825_003715 [Sarcosagium campestre]|nr:MAG: hypothetical protein M1825_003715 [Sarcosagium campestre]